MKMTNEEIKKILDGAPEWATHYINRGASYYRLGDIRSWKHHPDWTKNLSSLREIIELRQEVERLKVEAIKLLDAAICPCCDKSGAYYGNYGELCQCQWCDEVNQLREQGDE